MWHVVFGKQNDFIRSYGNVFRYYGAVILASLNKNFQQWRHKACERKMSLFKGPSLTEFHIDAVDTNYQSYLGCTDLKYQCLRKLVLISFDK